MYCVEQNININQLDNAVRVQLSQGRLPHVTKQSDGNYTVVAIRSPLVALYTLTCAELYGVPKAELESYLEWMAISKETNFIQVIAEGDMYLIIRLRTNCAEI